MVELNLAPNPNTASPFLQFDQMDARLNRELEARGQARLGEPAPPPQRGIPGQVLAGVGRGIPGVGRMVGEALSLAPGLRGTGEGIAQFFESLQPESSGGIVESAVESATQSLGTIGAIAAGAATAGITAGPLALAGGTAALFGAAEAANTREFLEGINQQLVAQGQEPLSAGEITQAMVANAGIEAFGEGVADYLFASRFGFGSRAFEGAKAAIRPFLSSSRVLRAVEEVGRSAIREGSTEAAQAAGQAAVTRGAVGEQNIQQLEAQGAQIPTAGQAARATVAPAALAGAIFAGVGSVAARRRAQPQQQPSTEIEEQGRSGPVQVPPGTPPPEPLIPGATQMEYRARQEGERGFVLLSEDAAARARFQAQARNPTAPEQPTTQPGTQLARRNLGVVGLGIRRPTITEGLPEPLGIPVERERPRPRRAPQAPLPDRLSQAEDTAIAMVIDEQDRGFENFDYKKLVGEPQREHNIPRPEAQRIINEAVSAAKYEGAPIIGITARPGRESVEVPTEEVPTPPQPAAQTVAKAATAAAPISEGLVATVRTDAGREVDTRYAVVDANDLITSNDLAGNINPDFPQILQPRDRTRVASTEQINRIINTLDPEQLTESRLASIGAPIVGPDLVVESGNARSLALKLGYQNQHANADAYRQFLANNAERFGIPRSQIEQIENPVLVRVRRGEMSAEDRIAFTEEANIQAQQAFSAAEAARQDARQLDTAILATFNPDQSGNIAAASNREFVRQFLQALPASERGALVNSEGSLSQQGVQRIRNAIFARTYGNPSVLERLAEDADSNIRNITTGMLLAAPQLARIKEGIQQGANHNIDLTSDVAAAAAKLSVLRDQGETVDNYLNQGGLFGEELSPLAKDILRFFDGNKRSSRRISEVLRNVAAIIDDLGDPRQVSLLGPETQIPTAAEVFKAAGDLYEAENNEQLDLTGETGRRAAVSQATPGQTSQPAGQERQAGQQYKGFTIRQVGEVFQVLDPQGAHVFRANSLEGARSRIDQRFPSGAQQFQVRQPQTQEPYSVTRSSLTRAFPRQKVTRNSDGTFTVHTPGGQVIVKSVDTIEPDHAAIELSYGRRLEAGERPVGQFQQLKDGTFEIRVTPEATEETLFHEAGHFFEDAGILSNQDIGTLNAALRRQNIPATPETRADFLAQQLNRVTNRNRPVDRILYRIQRFMDRLARAVGIRTAGQVTRRIQSGDLSTQVEAQAATPRFATTRAVPNTIEGVTVDTTDKPFLDYQIAAGIADAAGSTARLSDAAFRKLKISFSQLDEMAKQTMLRWMTKPGEFNRFLRNVRQPDFTPSSSAMMAFAKWEQTMLHDTLVKLNSGEIDAEEAKRRDERVIKLSMTVPGTSEAGRILRMSQAPFTTPGTLRFADFIRRLERKRGALTPEQQQQAMDLFRRAVQTGDPSQMLRLFDETTDPSLLDLYWEFYYGGLLSGIPTQTVNTLGTLMNITFQDTIVEGTSTALDALISGITGRQRTKYFREIRAGWNETWKNMGRAYKDAWYWWKSPLPTQIGGTGAQAELPANLARVGLSRRVELDVGAPSWQRATVESFPSALPQGAREGMAKFMNAFAPFMGAASRALQASDIAAKTLAFDATVARMATREAIKRGLPNEQHAAFVDDVKRNLEQYPEIEAEAMRNADDRTFNDTPSRLAQAFFRVRNMPNIMGFFLRMLIPFAGTPDRLIARGMEMVPGFGLPVGIQEKGLSYRGFLVGLKQGDERALEVAAKQLVGLALTMLAAVLWDEEKITGALSRNPAERDSQLRRGMIPHAIIINGQAYEYRRFEPLNIPIGLATSAFSALREIQNKRRAEGLDPLGAINEDGTAVAALAVGNMMRFVLDASYFSGLAGFFQSVQQGGGGIGQGLNRQLVSAVLPFVSLQRNLARTFESAGLVEGTEAGKIAVRERETIGQAFGAGIPGVSTQVTPRLNVFGQPIQTAGTSPETLASPLRRAPLSTDPVELEMERLRYYPAVRNRRSVEGSAGRRITDEEFQSFQQIRGQLAYQELQRIIDAPFFQNLPDEKKRQRIKAAFSRASRRAMREVFPRRRAAIPGL